MVEDKQKERIKQLESELDGLKKDYNALVNGKYICTSAGNSSRNPLYRVCVTEWGQDGSCGHGVMVVYQQRLVDAKAVESALKMLFREGNIRIETSVKDDVYDDTENNWHSV